MALENTAGEEGPFVGSRCLAGIGGIWAPATIRRVNEDNSFTIEFEEKDMLVMPYWYGVTPVEVSFDDQDKWPSVFNHLRADEPGMTVTVLERAFHLLDLNPGEEWITQLWEGTCQKLFDIDTARAGETVLDIERAYQVVRHVGFSAKEFVERLDVEQAPQSYYKLYWNQTRMGGREPGEISRPVTLDDAFSALGLTEDKVNHEMADLIQAFEEEVGVRLPRVLKTFLSREGVIRAVLDTHPNSPELLPQSGYNWELRRGIGEEGMKGDYAVTIMIPHQGNHHWVVAFYENEPDGRVYVMFRGERGEQWALTAPTIGMFFWDLAQTGLTWYQDTQFEGGKPAMKSDIGLILDI
jgi:hypothetical protein